MEESWTPWLIAEVARSSGAMVPWVWVSVLVGTAVVLVGGILFCS